ncbi:RNA-binding S4 domain-containing protein [Brucella rhizosphaerae]|uniref:S4 domain protein n=1 Tax=Brucella rhizosphaerae TaxID=571254 RepID=A0A256F915_9HYPH|nr:RNA-binding S4 domain-containing protein [Brucella rhizosphaerae]OYR11288.1 S4 domain protein [Brucella rhizosphaerae]
MPTEATARQRIDKWLFFARVVKSRSLAAKLAVGGKVRVNRDKIEQASHPVKIGDVLTITLDRHIVIYKVLDGGERRGPAPEAQLLYEDLTPQPTPETKTTEALQPRRESGAGRPTKKERRETDRLRGS